MNILNPSFQQLLEESKQDNFSKESIDRLFEGFEPSELISEESAEIFGLVLGAATASILKKNKVTQAISSADIVAINKLITSINRVKELEILSIRIPTPLGFNGNLLRYTKSLITWRKNVDREAGNMYKKLFEQAARAYASKDWRMIMMNEQADWNVENWRKELQTLNNKYFTSSDRDHAKVGDVFDNKNEIKETAAWVKKGRIDLSKIEKINADIERVADVLEEIKNAKITSTKEATANAAHVISTVAKFATDYASATMTIDNITNSIIKLQVEVSKL